MRKHWVHLRTLPFSALSLVFAAALATAAPAPTGSVEGVVRTSDGLVLPGVAVTLAGPASARRVTTGPDGSFRVDGLAAGEYAVSVDAPGLELREAATVAVGAVGSPGSAARTSPLDLVLAPAPVTERVVVSATRGEATLSSLGVAADVLDRQRIDDRAAPSLLPPRVPPPPPHSPTCPSSWPEGQAATPTRAATRKKRPRRLARHSPATATPTT